MNLKIFIVTGHVLSVIVIVPHNFNNFRLQLLLQNYMALVKDLRYPENKVVNFFFFQENIVKWHIRKYGPADKNIPI